MAKVVAAYGGPPAGPVEVSVLGAAGASVVFVDRLDDGEIADADALMVTLQPVDEDLLRAMPRCRIVSRAGTGVDLIDIEAASRMGVWVANVPAYSVDEVSSHAIALLLAHARHIPTLIGLARAGAWDARGGGPIRRLRGQTLGVLGFGRIGRAVAAKAMGLGLDVVAYDRYVASEEIAAAGVEPVAWEALLRRSDFVSLHVPLTPETRGVVDRAALALVKPGAVLLNTARGPLVDEVALLEAVRDGRLAGAAVDVLAEEPPPPDHPFLAEERIWVTPHAGWYSEEAGEDMIRLACENVARVLQGRRPLYPLNEPMGVGRA